MFFFLQILINFSWILVQKSTKVRNFRSFWFFWHPEHPWGRLSSGDTWVLRFVLNISLQWRLLAEFFSFIKMISHVSFINLVLKITLLSVSLATKVTILKICYLIRLRFEQSEHKKSQCVIWHIFFRMENFLKSSHLYYILQNGVRPFLSRIWNM